MRAIFLDRDGTIIEEVNYLSNFSQIKLLKNVKEGIEVLKNLNYKIFIITNQSGIARGYFSEEFVKKVNSFLCNQLGIDDFFYCPHLPEDNCECRKPNIGLIKKAIKKFPNINLKDSFFIGDKEIDIITGINAGMKSILVMTGYGGKEALCSNANYIVKDLYYASILIKNLS